MNFMGESKLIDSNMLVYAFDKSEPEKHKRAVELLKSCFDGKERGVLALQNISEFYLIITTKIEKPVPKKDALEICRKLICFSGFTKLAPKGTTLLYAMELNEQYKVHYWDAMIAATMLENQVTTIYTENTSDFAKIPSIRVINPFRKK